MHGIKWMFKKVRYICNAVFCNMYFCNMYFCKNVILQWVFLQLQNYPLQNYIVKVAFPIIFQHGVSLKWCRIFMFKVQNTYSRYCLIYLKSVNLVIDDVNVKWILSLKITNINSLISIFKCEMLKAQSMLLCCRFNSIIHLLWCQG